MTQIADGTSHTVVSEGKEWIKIKSDGETGYVASEYVKLKDILKKAEPVKEEPVVQTNTSSQTSSSRSSVSRSSASSSSSTSHSSSYSASSSSKGQAIANYALQFVGNPYVYGGTSLTNGTDCSGFTQAVMRKFGISIPRDSRSQSGVGTSIRASEAKAGDLVFYARNGRINHVALCIGNGKVVSASSPSTGIRVSSLYYRTPVAVKRVL